MIMKNKSIGSEIELKNIKNEYDKFLNIYKKKIIMYKDNPLEYYSCGKGKDTILFTPHISSVIPLEINFNRIMDYEDCFKVIAPALPNVENIDELAESINTILKEEKIDKVIVFGQSGSGITAQIFFSRFYKKIKALILVNTVIPKTKKKNNLNIIFNVLPEFLLKYFIKIKLKKYYKLENIPNDFYPKIMFTKNLLEQQLKKYYTKEKIIRDFNLINSFNNENILIKKTLQNWDGKLLIITSEDDPLYEDSKMLNNLLPNSQIHIFKEEYGHLTPSIKSNELKQVIQNFLLK
jgi:pimeloyl-ACP methyl ester carboxylesterase